MPCGANLVNERARTSNTPDIGIAEVGSVEHHVRIWRAPDNTTLLVDLVPGMGDSIYEIPGLAGARSRVPGSAAI